MTSCKWFNTYSLRFNRAWLWTSEAGVGGGGKYSRDCWGCDLLTIGYAERGRMQMAVYWNTALCPALIKRHYSNVKYSARVVVWTCHTIFSISSKSLQQFNGIQETPMAWVLIQYMQSIGFSCFYPGKDIRTEKKNLHALVYSVP